MTSAQFWHGLTVGLLAASPAAFVLLALLANEWRWRRRAKAARIAERVEHIRRRHRIYWRKAATWRAPQ